VSAHGAVGGRVVGDGNTSTEQQGERPGLGDPARDPIGTWRIAPFDEGAPQDWRREYEADRLRAIRIYRHEIAPWCLVDPADGAREMGLWLDSDEVRDWPVTTSTAVAVAHRLAAPQPSEPARVLGPVEGEDVAYPFRDPKGK
jgi:hypothetical protein